MSKPKLQKPGLPKVVDDCHELLRWLIPHLDKFPRNRRFTLGEHRVHICHQDDEPSLALCFHKVSSSVGNTHVFRSFGNDLVKTNYGAIISPLGEKCGLESELLEVLESRETRTKKHNVCHSG